MNGINFFIRAQGSKLGQDYGINRSRIYYVTTLPRVEDHDVQTMNLYWKESASLFQSAEMSSLVYFRQMAAIKINMQPLLISISSILRLFLYQVYFVLVLTSTNHNARNRYPEMVRRFVICNNIHLQK